MGRTPYRSSCAHVAERWQVIITRNAPSQRKKTRKKSNASEYWLLCALETHQWASPISKNFTGSFPDLKTKRMGVSRNMRISTRKERHGWDATRREDHQRKIEKTERRKERWYRNLRLLHLPLRCTAKAEHTTISAHCNVSGHLKYVLYASRKLWKLIVILGYYNDADAR